MSTIDSARHTVANPNRTRNLTHDDFVDGDDEVGARESDAL